MKRYYREEEFQMDMETGVKPQASVSTLSMTLGLFALGIAWRNAAKMFSIPPPSCS